MYIYTYIFTTVIFKITYSEFFICSFEPSCIQTPDKILQRTLPHTYIMEINRNIKGVVIALLIYSNSCNEVIVRKIIHFLTQKVELVSFLHSTYLYINGLYILALCIIHSSWVSCC